MVCRCAPALGQLRKEVNTRWPNRDKASDGCCGDPAHAARESDHNPTNGFAHALDIDENIHPHSTDPAPLRFLVPILLEDPRTKYVIYETRIHRPGRPSQHYDESNPHDKHLHLSILPGATHDTRPWLNGPVHTTEDDDMTPEQLNTIKAAIKESEDRTVAAIEGHATTLRDTLAALVRRLAAKLGINPTDI